MIFLYLKSGVNLASFSGDDLNVDSKTGFYAGIFTQFKLSEIVAFQPELIYSQQGAKAKNGMKLKTDYLVNPYKVIIVLITSVEM